MTYWQEATQQAKELGLEVSILEDTFWGRFMAKCFKVNGFNPGWHVWIAHNDFGTTEGAWTLKHELVHRKQFKKWWGIGFWLGYLLPWPRIKWEVEAYKTSMRRSVLNVGYVTGAVKAAIYRSLRGPTYWFYGRVCPTLKWVEQAAVEVEQEK